MDDRMNRQLSSNIQINDRAVDFAEELVCYGLINDVKPLSLVNLKKFVNSLVTCTDGP